MAEEDNLHDVEAVPEEEESSSYKPPPEKSLEDMLNQDREDEALQKYKETLLGSASRGAIVLDPSSEKRVLVRKLALVVDGQADRELDLTGELESIKESNFIIKEGISYRIRIDFHVQREIVTGLKYIQKTYRKGICVDKMTQMVGSYAPKEGLQSFTTTVEDAPSGLVARGHYTVKSLFTDDDENEHLKWEWSFNIKKDWE